MSINKYRQPQPTRLAFAVASITTLLAFASTPLQAQQPTEEIMVTGSRISRDVGFSSPVPVTAINTEELRMFDPGLGVSQQLENLPQFFNNVSSDNIANRVTADVGQSQLNMRGMGGNRTLVLLDGLRVVPSDRRSSVSVDYLPSTLMQRVDVVTGGASAAYGSDALAGVTNFVLNRNFTGLDIRTSTGINEEGDGEFNRASVTFGDDFLDRLPGDGLDVSHVGRGGVGHDGGGVAVDQDDLVALLAQRLAGLHARVIKLTGLADDDRAGANDQDTFDVATLGHILECSLLFDGDATWRCNDGDNSAWACR
mgnify:CR=1 FL=1